MLNPLSDCSPLISAAASGKLRLVRLLVEGGAQVNGRNPRGETALLAACKALRGEPAGEPSTVKLVTYLLQNKADPNAQDRAGCTALMYACMERAGAQVASTLLAAGADPSMEDHSGASALVYAINAQHRPTLKVLMDACRARGRDIIIIATEMGVSGGPVTRRYLNVPPSPDTSPVSCMSPSDIVLKTGSPSSPEGENIFNFRGTSKRGSSSRHRSCEPSLPRQRVLSEPWLAIHNLACLNRAYEEGRRERSQRDEGDREGGGSRGRGGREDEEGEDEDAPFPQPRMEERAESVVQRGDKNYGGENHDSWRGDFLPRVSQPVPPPTERSSSQAPPGRPPPKMGLMPSAPTSVKVGQNSRGGKLPARPSPHTQPRRNTLPSVTVAPPLHLPPLVSQSHSHLQVPPPKSSSSVVSVPHPPCSSPPPPPSPRASEGAVLEAGGKHSGPAGGGAGDRR